MSKGGCFPAAAVQVFPVADLRLISLGLNHEVDGSSVYEEVAADHSTISELP